MHVQDRRSRARPIARLPGTRSPRHHAGMPQNDVSKGARQHPRPDPGALGCPSGRPWAAPTPTPPCLRLRWPRNQHLASHLDERPPHPNGAGHEVDVSTFERRDLPEPHACEGGQQAHRRTEVQRTASAPGPGVLHWSRLRHSFTGRRVPRGCPRAPARGRQACRCIPRRCLCSPP
jgi:hypothetical protein